MSDRPRPIPLSLEVQSERVAGEYAARSLGIPKPALAAFWRWRAERRGEVAIREAPTRGARRGGE